MSNETNDQRILLLKKQIEEKKNKLNKLQRFSPATNCTVELDGIRYNLHTLSSKDSLINLMVRINLYRISAKDLGVQNEYLISGFSPEEWLTDIKAKLGILSQKQEEANLKQMEDKLTQLLSERKKVELELDQIESLIKG
jgi:hypothetical protein